MTGCFHSVVARGAQALAPTMMALLVACGQKGALVAAKPAAPPVSSSGAAAFPASAPAATLLPR